MKYILITPARNEELFIAKTLVSMLAQTMKPERWIIVDDGSTDRTAEIVQNHVVESPWIEVVRRPQRVDRSFAAKVQGFNAGLEQIKELAFDILGNLDADISFDADYFEFLLQKFEGNGRLGVAGTPFVEHGNRYDDWNAVNHDALRAVRSALSRREPLDPSLVVPVPGSRLVVEVMNHYKRKFAFIDLLKPE